MIYLGVALAEEIQTHVKGLLEPHQSLLVLAVFDECECDIVERASDPSRYRSARAHLGLERAAQQVQRLHSNNEYSLRPTLLSKLIP